MPSFCSGPASSRWRRQWWWWLVRLSGRRLRRCRTIGLWRWRTRRRRVWWRHLLGWWRWHLWRRWRRWLSLLGLFRFFLFPYGVTTIGVTSAEARLLVDVRARRHRWKLSQDEVEEHRDQAARNWELVSQARRRNDKQCAPRPQPGGVVHEQCCTHIHVHVWGVLFYQGPFLKVCSSKKNFFFVAAQRSRVRRAETQALRPNPSPLRHVDHDCEADRADHRH